MTDDPDDHVHCAFCQRKLLLRRTLEDGTVEEPIIHIVQRWPVFAAGPLAPGETVPMIPVEGKVPACDECFAVIDGAEREATSQLIIATDLSGLWSGGLAH